jgi:hypothetical protein
VLAYDETPGEITMTAQDVAQWMFNEVRERKIIDHALIADQIRKQFGDEYTYENENGNLAISKDVLKAFRSLSEETVVWEGKSWRLRTPLDRPGRKQD